MTTRKRITDVLTVLSVAVLTFGLAGTSSADLVSYDVDTGGADTGFSGGFFDGSRNVFPIDAPDLTYANYGIAQTGTTQRVYSCNTSHPDRQDVRDLATAVSGEIWFSVLVNVPTGGNFAGLSFNYGSPTYEHTEADARILMTTSQRQVGFKGGALTTGTGTFAADTTHLLLGKMNVAAGDDTLSVWVDLDLTAVSGPGDLPAANFTSTTVDFTDSIVSIGVPASNPSGVYIDAIWLSDTATAFEDVTGVTGAAPGTVIIVR